LTHEHTRIINYCVRISPTGEKTNMYYFSI